MSVTVTDSLEVGDYDHALVQRVVLARFVELRREGWTSADIELRLEEEVSEYLTALFGGN